MVRSCSFTSCWRIRGALIHPVRPLGRLGTRHPVCNRRKRSTALHRKLPVLSARPWWRVGLPDRFGISNRGHPHLCSCRSHGPHSDIATLLRRITPGPSSSGAGVVRRCRSSSGGGLARNQPPYVRSARVRPSSFHRSGGGRSSDSDRPAPRLLETPAGASFDRGSGGRSDLGRRGARTAASKARETARRPKAPGGFLVA